MGRCRNGSAYTFIFICVMRVHMHEHTHRRVCIHNMRWLVCLSVLSINLFVCLPYCPPARALACSSVGLSVRPSACPFVLLYIYLSLHPSVRPSHNATPTRTTYIVSEILATDPLYKSIHGGEIRIDGEYWGDLRLDGKLLLD